MQFKKNDEAVSPVIGVILMVAITVILAAVIAAFVFGMGTPTKAPQVQLKFIATSTGGDTASLGVLKISHDGGDPIVLKDEKITIRNAVTDQIVSGVDSLFMQASTSGFTTAPDTLPAGSSITNTSMTLVKGDIIKITILDIPSGQLISSAKVTVT